MTLCFIAKEKTKLLPFLREHVTSYPSVKTLKRAIEERACSVNGRVVTYSTHTLSRGDEVLFQFAPSTLLKLELKVLFEDDFLLAVNKPAGLVCENENFHKLLPKSYSNTLLVHRLDKDTSGVILLAKDISIKEKMIVLFQKKQVAKKYLAIVYGQVEKNSGREDTFFVMKSFSEGQTNYGSSKNAEGKHAVTLWKTLSRGNNASLMLCEPVTGRTHQLRIHLAEMGHPILGDLQYGKMTCLSMMPKRHLLHAFCLNFPHPIFEKEVFISAEAPSDFSFALQRFHLQFDEQST